MELEQVRNHPSAQRAYEFIQLGRFVDARTGMEPFCSLNSMVRRTRRPRCWRVNGSGMISAIWTLAQIGHFDAINIRFPMAYGQLLTDSSNKVGIDPTWAMAITRRESAFRADAYSSAGNAG